MKPQALLAWIVVWMTCLTALPADQQPPVPKQPDLRAHLLTKPQVLFTIRWGSGSDQLYKPLEPGDWYGPCELHVSSQDSVYLVLPGGVRLFDRSGRLLKRLPVQADPEDRWVSIPAVDSQGRVMAFCFEPGKEKILVTGRDGKRLKQVESFLQSAVEQARSLAKSTRRSDVIGLDLKCLPDGRLIVGDGYRIDPVTGTLDKVPERADSPQVNAHRGYLYQVEVADPGVPGKKWYVYRTGEVYYTEVDWTEGCRLKILVHDDKGRLLREVQLPSGELSEVEKQLPFYIGLHAVDGRGHFYLTRYPRVVYDVPLFEQDYQRYIGVVEYDKTGKFVGLRAICESFSPCNITVDKEGNVYWLAPSEDGVKVMMAPVPTAPVR
jgi:hypothetical protein